MQEMNLMRFKYHVRFSKRARRRKVELNNTQGKFCVYKFIDLLENHEMHFIRWFWNGF